MNLQGLPAFVLSVIVLFWSPTIGCFIYAVKFLKLFGLRNDAFTWARFLVSFFRIKVVKYGTNVPCQERCLFLSNHRSWADFFLDAYLSEGRAMLLSRMMVGAVFPCIVASVHILKGIVLFKRAKIRDQEAFNKFLDTKIDESPMASLLIFPEGTRNTKPESLPLRTGLLKYAHSRKLPVQVVMSSGKDKVLNEKSLKVGFGTTVVTGYSEVIRSGEYTDVEDFIERVKTSWADMWDKVHAANPAELPELEPNYPLYQYPASMRLLHLVKEIAGIWLFYKTINVWVGLMVLAYAAKLVAVVAGGQQAGGRKGKAGGGVDGSSNGVANGVVYKSE